MNEDEIKAKLAQYKFYHIIKLTENIYTPGNPIYVESQNFALEALRKMNLVGKRVLDIGCRDGLFSFEAEKMGASEVIGIDNDLSKPAIEFLIPYFKSNVRMYEMNLYDLNVNSFGLFDVVIFTGVLYHLRYPFWGLKIVRDVLKDNGKLLIETGMWRNNSQYAMLYCPIGSESPYEGTSITFFNEKGLIDSLYSLGIKTELIEYLTKQTERKTIIVKFQQIIKNFFQKTESFNPATNIDRAILMCSVSKDIQDEFYKNYWNDRHTFHTERGG